MLFMEFFVRSRGLKNIIMMRNIKTLVRASTTRAVHHWHGVAVERLDKNDERRWLLLPPPPSLFVEPMEKRRARLLFRCRVDETGSVWAVDVDTDSSKMGFFGVHTTSFCSVVGLEVIGVI